MTAKELFKKVTGRNAPWCIVVEWETKKFNWLTGFALGPIVFALKDRPDVVCHEMVHVEQFYRGLGIFFWLRYAYYQLRYGYRLNPYEEEAYAVQTRAKGVLALA